MESNESPLESKTLANGVAVTLFDRSRRVAGDRWRIELICEATLPVAEESWTEFAGEEPETVEAVRAALGDRLTFSVSRIRHFIDEGQRREVMDELIRRVRENMLDYLADEKFPGLLLARRFKEEKQRLLLERRRQGINTGRNRSRGT